MSEHHSMKKQEWGKEQEQVKVRRTLWKRTETPSRGNIDNRPKNCGMYINSIIKQSKAGVNKCFKARMFSKNKKCIFFIFVSLQNTKWVNIRKVEMKWKSNETFSIEMLQPFGF